jgi:hypothetical protein
VLYIQVDVTLIDHPKTKKLARLLSISRTTAVGHLVALWSWAAQYAPDGDLTDYRAEPDAIADAAQWEGEPAQFVNALINARIGAGSGFLEDSADGSLLLHDWPEYFGKLLERRRTDAERKRSERRETSVGHPQDGARKSTVNVAKLNVAQRSEAQPSVADQVAPAAPEQPEDPVTRAVCNAYDAVGLMVTSSHLEVHRATIKRTGLTAWQLGWAAALQAGKHNVPAYVARCAESAMIAEQRAAGGKNGHGAAQLAARDATDDERQAMEASIRAAEERRATATTEPSRDDYAELLAEADAARGKPLPERTFGILRNKLTGIWQLPAGVTYDMALAEIKRRMEVAP